MTTSLLLPLPFCHQGIVSRLSRNISQRCPLSASNTTINTDIPPINKRKSIPVNHKKSVLDAPHSSLNEKNILKSLQLAARKIDLSKSLTSPVGNRMALEQPRPHDKREDGPINTTLSACTNAMTKILQRRDAMQSSSYWSRDDSSLQSLEYFSIPEEVSHNEQDLMMRYQLFQDTLKLLKAINLSIQSGRITASSGKDIRSLSALLGNCLIICSETPPTHVMKEFLPDGTQIDSPFNTTIEITTTLRQLNLDIQPINYAGAIKAAYLEGKWKDAATIFSDQIHPEIGQCVPMDSTLGWEKPLEMGLYAVAKAILESRDVDDCKKSTLATEKVFDLVMDMCLVSPTDQDKFVLAAGSALGRAFLWDGLIAYQQISDNRTKFGQSLIAAAMLACMLGGQYDRAISLYYSLRDDEYLTGTEWQWGGKYKCIHPLCKDLFLRASGKSSSKIDADRCAEDAIKTFDEILNDDGRLSPTALLGLLVALQKARQYMAAIESFDKILHHHKGISSWSIVKEDVSNFIDVRGNYPVDTCFLSGNELINGTMVASVMNCCANAGEFGLALVISRLAELATSRNSGNKDFSIAHMGENISDLNRNGARLIASSQFILGNEECFHAALMSLYGLNCGQVVVNLASNKVMFNNHQTDMHDANMLSGSQKNDDNSLNVPWLEAYEHIHQFTDILTALDFCEARLDNVQMSYFTQGVARLIDCCTKAGQPRTGLYLARRFAFALSTTATTRNSALSMKQLLSSVLGIGDSTFLSTSHDAFIEFVTSSDSILCATMHAYESAIHIDDALRLFFSGDQLLKEENSSPYNSHKFAQHLEWINSVNAALSMLVKSSRTDDALSLFRMIPVEIRTPDTYSTVAHGLAIMERWVDVAALYSAASEYGCISEDLAFLAMKGVEQSMVEGKIRVLRSIADDMAMLVGQKSDDWIQSRYWMLKRFVGFHYARLLMWWNDPSLTNRHEFNLAVRHFEDSKTRGTNIMNDILRVIVKFGGVRFRETEDESDRVNGANIVLDAIIEADRTFLLDDPQFVSDAAVTLQELGNYNECVDLLLGAARRGIKLNKRIVASLLDNAPRDGSVPLLDHLSQYLETAPFQSVPRDT